MKKAILFILIFLFGLNICACQNAQPLEITEESTQAKQTTHTETQNDSETQPTDKNAVFCLYELFMDNTNLNGNLLGPSETDQHGDIAYGYPSPDSVPVTDRSDLYGTTYRLNLTAHKNKHLFCFRYDTATNRLEVVIPYERISLLLIFRVEGIEDGGAIIRSAETGEYLSATLLYARNIDNGRVMGLQSAFSHLADQPNSTILLRSGYILGYAVGDGTYLLSTWGNHDAFGWMDKIISLYGEKAS